MMKIFTLDLLLKNHRRIYLMSLCEATNREAGRFFESLSGELKTTCTRFFTEKYRFVKKSLENLFNGNLRVAE